VNVDELLGIDPADDDESAIEALVEADERLLDELRDLRKRNGLSQQDVADRLGVTQGAIARIEGGSRDPRLSTLRRYAFAVGADVRHVVTARVGRSDASRTAEEFPHPQPVDPDDD